MMSTKLSFDMESNIQLDEIFLYSSGIEPIIDYWLLIICYGYNRPGIIIVI